MGAVALLEARKERRCPPPKPTLTPEEQKELEELEATFGPVFPTWRQMMGNWQHFLGAVMMVAAFAVLLVLFWPPILVASLGGHILKR